MELTNGEIFVAREPLAQLINQKFPVKTAYELAKLANKLNEQLKVIDDVRNGLVKTYGEPLEDNPNQISVKQDSESYGKFMGDIVELMNKEENIDIKPVKLPEKVASTCDSCHHNMDRPLEIEPAVLMALEKFIEV